MLSSNSKHIPNLVALGRPFLQWPRRNAAFDAFRLLWLRSTGVKPRRIRGCASVEQEDGRPSIWTIHRPSRLRVPNLGHHTDDLSKLAKKVIMASSCDMISWLFYREGMRYVVRCFLCINMMDSGAVCPYHQGTLKVARSRGNEEVVQSSKLNKPCTAIYCGFKAKSGGIAAIQRQ